MKQAAAVDATFCNRYNMICLPVSLSSYVTFNPLTPTVDVWVQL